MKLNEKIRALRQQKGMTQEELAAALYVTRAAVAKWESGRGCPNVDSLRAVAGLFSVTVDELLSDSEDLPEDRRARLQKKELILDRIFGAADLAALLLLVLPFFGQRMEETVQPVSLLQLTGAAPYVHALCMACVLGMAGMGVWMLTLRCKRTYSLMLHELSLMLMIITRQPYAAVYLFLLLGVKGVALRKKQ